MFNKNTIYLTLLTSIFIAFLRYYESIDFSLNAKLIFEIIGSILQPFLIIIFLIYKYEKRKLINKTIYIAILVTSFISYIYFTYSSFSQVLHIPVGALYFTAAIILLTEIVNYIFITIKFEQVKTFFILLIIPLSIYLSFRVGNKEISNYEHSENIKQIHVHIGMLKKQLELSAYFSKIDNLDVNNKYQRIEGVFTDGFFNTINFINSDLYTQELLKKNNFCKEWNMINQNWLYNEKNKFPVNTIEDINKLCIKK